MIDFCHTCGHNELEHEIDRSFNEPCKVPECECREYRPMIAETQRDTRRNS